MAQRNGPCEGHYEKHTESSYKERGCDRLLRNQETVLRHEKGAKRGHISQTRQN